MSGEALSAEACGKVILVGEHAVVYGTPAIALGVGAAAYARVVRAERARLRMGALDLVLDRTPGGSGAAGAEERLEARAYRALLDSLVAPNLDASVELKLPAGVGLGASAALAVALARASASACRRSAHGESTVQESAERVLAAAQAWENVFHGNASGIDAAAAYHGGCLWFTRARGASALRPGAPLTLGVAVAGPAASTRLMVERVAEYKLRSPASAERALAAIGELVGEAKNALEGADWQRLGALMDQNHALLKELGVSTPELERACLLARQANALGAKLTGGGGGGCVIALPAPGRVDGVLQAWRAAGLTCFEARVESTVAPG